MNDELFLDELKKDFFEEAQLMLETMETSVLQLEKDPGDSEAINEMFRAAHTLKGGSATLDLDRIAQFTHELESMLDEVRSEHIKLNEEAVEILLKSIDVVKELLSASQKGEEIAVGIENEIIKKLQDLYLVKSEQSSKEYIESFKKKIEEEKEKSVKSSIPLNEYERYLVKTSLEEDQNVFQIRVLLNAENPMKTVSGIQIFSMLKDTSEIIKSIPDTDDLMEDQFYRELLFIISTDLSRQEIHKKIFLSDVTDLVDIDDFEEEYTEEKKQDITGTTIQLSEAENEKMQSLLYDTDNTAFRVDVIFDDTNPMRSVSGLLVYSTLRSLGEVIKSEPSFDELRKDKFYHEASFIFVSQHKKNHLYNKLFISDVTKKLDIEPFVPSDEEEKGMTTVKAESEQEKEKIEVKDSPQEEKAAKSEQTEKAPTKSIKEEPKEEATPTKQSVKQTTTSTTVSSLIRVPSERIDEMLTLVGELVISKAGVNQLNDRNTQALDSFVSNNANFKKQVKLLFSEMQEFFESKVVEDENITTELKERFKQKFDSILSTFDTLVPEYKSLQDMFRSTSQSLSRITNELQESVMKVRMVPVNQIFSRFPRLIRDLAKNLNKIIELEIQGEETELDKGMVEDLIDPLIHMVRNAVDHGIETPQEREAKGKPKQGKILLKAEHEGNNVAIIIKDDGKGLDYAKIRKKATDNGLIEPNQELSNDELLMLTFQPGFSTAEQVSQVSGRGVGLDVVKKKIDNLRGTISIESEKDKGSTFYIRLPLTTAIIQALMVEVSGYIYSIPIASVVETLRISPDEIEMLEDNEVIRNRDEILSLIRLSTLFKFKSNEDQEFYYVIIVGAGSKKVGFIVDSLIGEEDIVIKPLNRKYAQTPGMAGAALLGDGQITLILDVNGILELALSQKRKAMALNF